MTLSRIRIRLMGLCIAALVLAADQVTKSAVIEASHLPHFPIVLLPFFNLVLVWNHGISFGMLGGLRAWFAVALTLGLCCIVLVLLVWLLRASNVATAIALAFITGGAAGNIADRFTYRAVADFLDFHIGVYHWPAFNVADSAIFIGVVILLGISIYSPRPQSAS